MTKKITLALTLATALMVMGAAPAIGQTTTLTCTPVSSTATVNTQVSFIVSGGNGTFSFAGSGINSSTTTNPVFSTSFSNTGPQTFTVSSGGQTAACNVNIVAAGSSGVFCASPTGTILVGQPATFTATGGNGTFSWSATDLSISNPLGTSFTANYTTPGVHLVTVSSNGQSATCAVSIQPAASTSGTLMCSPVTQTAIVGNPVNFTATGGNGTYVWSATDLTLVNPTGSSFRATYGSAGTHVVTVTSGTETANCTVTVNPASTTGGGTPGLPNTGYAPGA